MDKLITNEFHKRLRDEIIMQVIPRAVRLAIGLEEKTKKSIKDKQGIQSLQYLMERVSKVTVLCNIIYNLCVNLIDYKFTVQVNS